MNISSVSHAALVILVSTLVACTPLATMDSAVHEPAVIFLVRHAEKADSGPDPRLTAAGHDRATRLAVTLGSAQIAYVHSSDYARTRDTAAPVAAALGLEVQLYDPRDLPGLAAQLRQTGGRHLVVGHSNTTPALVELLGAKPGVPIDEAGEYDRLYIVTIARDGTTDSALLRYGNSCT